MANLNNTFLTASQIRNAEDDYQQQLIPGAANTAAAQDIVPTAFPFRPDYTSSGDARVLPANFFQFTCSLSNIYKYIITVNVDNGHVTSGKRKEVIRSMFDSLPPNLKPKVATDFTQILVSSMDLSSQSSVRLNQDVHVPLLSTLRQYHYRLSPSGTLNPRSIDLSTRAVSSQNANPDREDILHCLNIILGHNARYNSLGPAPSVMSIGSKRHHSLTDNPDRDSKDLGEGLKVWQGYTMSARSSSAGLVLQVQPKATPAFVSAPLTELIDQYRHYHHGLLGLDRFLRGIKVSMSYQHRHVRSIDGLVARNGPDSWSAPSQVRFTPTNPPRPTTTVLAHFQTTYPNVQVTDDYPVIRFAPSIHVPADLLTVEPGQPALRQLDDAQVRKVKEFAQRTPPVNLDLVQRQCKTALHLLPAPNNVPNNIPPNTQLAGFGVAISANVLRVPSVQLDRPRLSYGQSGAVSNAAVKSTDDGWSQLLRPTKSSAGTNVFRECGRFKLGALFILGKGRFPPGWYQHRTDGFVKFRKLACPPLNLPANYPEEVVRINTPNPDLADLHSIEKAMQKLQHKLKESGQPGQSEFVMVFSHFTLAAIYNRVHQCSNHLGLQASFYQGYKFFSKCHDSYYRNVVLKINQKFGGINQQVTKLHESPLFQGPDSTMLVGIDVTHPTGGGDVEEGVSRGAIVANFGSNLAQFPGALFDNPARQEEVASLELLIKDRLKLWQRKNQNHPPKRIVVFRDGVSEGQYERVATYEVDALKQALNEIYQHNERKPVPKLTFIICGKRHNTRFYTEPNTPRELKDRNGNPLPGTLVDRFITEARPWDFFLLAQKALQGTARPTHYYVLHDEIFKGYKTANPPRNATRQLSELIFNLCHAFQRSTTSISLATPAYYADLLCTRGAAWLADQRNVARLSGNTIPAGPAQPQAGVPGPTRIVPIHAALCDTMHYI